MEAILPRIGIGPLRFGQTRTEVDTILGRPDEKACNVPGRETWKYSSLHLDASFGDEADWQLVDLYAEHQRYTLRGHAIIGMPVDHFATIASALGLGTPRQDADPPFKDPTYIFPRHNLRVESFDGIVVGIGWGVVIDDRDDYVWPLRLVSA